MIFRLPTIMRQSNVTKNRWMAPTQQVYLALLLIVCALVASEASASLSPRLFTKRTQRSLSHCNPNNEASRLLSLYKIRGGSSEQDPTSIQGATYNYGSAQQQQPAPQMNNPPPFATGDFIDEAGMGSTPGTTADPMYGYRETVEDRIDAWRKQQQQLQQSQSAEDAASPMDDQGRFKLFTHVSRVSVAFFFFILMWRTVHHYELADATFGNRSGKGGLKAALLRTIIVTPLVVLFLGEMMGALLGITGGGGMIGASSSANHTTKKRLKGILNLHKFVELVMIVYNVFRLAIWPSKYVMREVYIGRTISNFFFLIQAQLYTKLSWDDVSVSSIGEGGYATESYYDDYTPEMDENWQSMQSTATDGGDYYNRQDISPPQSQEYQQNYNAGSGWNQ